jgi:hypothetical protein
MAMMTVRARRPGSTMVARNAWTRKRPGPQKRPQAQNRSRLKGLK